MSAATSRVTAIGNVRVLCTDTPQLIPWPTVHLGATKEVTKFLTIYGTRESGNVLKQPVTKTLF